MSYPADLKYRDSHEWIRVDGLVATVGISHFAQDSLGDVVYVDMPEVGTAVSAGDAIAEIESVKAVSDIYAPVSGEIVAINNTRHLVFPRLVPYIIDAGCFRRTQLLCA